MRTGCRRALVLVLVGVLPSCGGSGGSSGGPTFDLCGGDPAPCDSLGYGIISTGPPPEELPVGQSLEAYVSLEGFCPCQGGIASVEWSASPGDFVSLAAGSGRSIVVTGLVPGQATLTAAVTFTSGVARSVENRWYSTSPFLVTVVPAPGS